MTLSPLRIGIDLGGTKTELIALDASGRELHRKRVATPAHEYDAIVRCIAGLVVEAETLLGRTASVGVATPGALSLANGNLRNSNTACLNGRPLDRDLAAVLGRPIRIANDANCFALSEAVDGSGRGAEVVFGVILGTGVGGGVVIDRRILTGKHAIAGEWGHNPLPWPRPSEQPGPACYCGKQGCIETFLSGPALARDYAGGATPVLPATSVAERAQAGEPLALQALDRYADRLARSLATVINLIDPDVVVLGGGVSQVESLVSEVPLRLPAYVFCDRVETRVVRALYGDSSGVRGAAWLWPLDAGS